MSSSGQNGLVAFVVSAILLSFLAGPTTCNDGWHSPSIGRQGACSWHGGVNNTPQFLALLTSAFIGLVAYVLSLWIEEKREKALQEAIRGEGVPIAPINPETQNTVPEAKKIAETLRKIAGNAASIKSEITCPLCGSVMQKRLAKRGPRKGKYFLGCGRYPMCRGTRNL